MLRKIFFVLLFTVSFVSFSQENTVSNLLASPNPFSTSTNISFNANKETKVFLMIRDILGKTVFRKEYYAKTGKNDILFERHNLKAGMYVYTIRSDRKVVSKRFVIK